jgi:hypothetical protein
MNRRDSFVRGSHDAPILRYFWHSEALVQFLEALDAREAGGLKDPSRLAQCSYSYSYSYMSEYRQCARTIRVQLCGKVESAMTPEAVACDWSS